MTIAAPRARKGRGLALSPCYIVAVSAVGLACASEPDGPRPHETLEAGAREGGGGSESGGARDGAGGDIRTGGAGGASASGGAGGVGASGGSGGAGASGSSGGSATGSGGAGGSSGIDGGTTDGRGGIGGAGASGGRDGSSGGAGGATDAAILDSVMDGRADVADANGDSRSSDAAPPTACPPPAAPAKNRFAGYYGIYAEQVSSPSPAGKDTPLAKLPGYVNIVNIAFMRPDASYAAGSFKLAGTGVEPAYWAVADSGQIMRDAIAELHRNNPETLVMISVGGATYFNWGAFNPETVAAFVGDMGLDGVDLDFEPGDASVHCTQSMGKMSCLSDKTFVDIVARMRAAMPRPKRLSMAAWSVGAFGEDRWIDAQPPSEFRGMALALLRSSAAPALDWVNVMSFDAGPTYNPVEALSAYQNYFCGPVHMGVEVPPEAWGGHVYTLTEVRALADAVTAQKGGGMMMWELHKPGGGTESNPSAQLMATAVCEKLGLGSCSDPLIR
jgi:chitinase